MRRRRLQAVSRKRQRERRAFLAVYAEVDRRSRGRCEVTLPNLTCAWLAEEHHHTRKPRASAANHRPEFVIHLCRGHHRMTERPYRYGRLVIDPCGDGRFVCSIVIAADKFAARQE